MSQVIPGESDQVDVSKTDYEKCGRCWRHLPEVTDKDGLCGRCDGVVNG